MQRSSGLRRTGRIKPRPRRAGKMPPEVYETVMWTRARGECEGRIPGVCTRRAEEWHHRQRRQPGNDVVVNGAALCRACHAYITDKSPSEGRERGLIVGSHHPDPGAVPMLWRGRWYFLEPDGSRRPAPEGVTA